MANEKARYSDEDLAEFRAIIEEKLKVAKQTYRDCMAQLNHSDSNDVVDHLQPIRPWKRVVRLRARRKSSRWLSASRSLSRAWRLR